MFMARITNKAVLADRQNEQQPSLLDDGQMPLCLPVLESIRAKRYEFTGARLVEDDQRALRLVELLMARWGVKRISREMHISPHTVRAARRELTRQGKIAPYVQRVVESMEDAFESGINNYRDALEDGRISPTQIPVGWGIIFDKRQLATNQATSISSRIESVDEELRVEVINAFFEKLPVANGRETDSVSNGNCENSKQISKVPVIDVTLDATEGNSREPSLSGRADDGPAAPTADPGGGGGAVPGDKV